MYAPHRMLRTYISRKIYIWADKKYGVDARSGNSPFTENDRRLNSKWHYWMKIKNIINNKI